MPGESFTRGFAPEEGVNGLIFAIADIDTPVTVSNIDTYAEDLVRPSRNPRKRTNPIDRGGAASPSSSCLTRRPMWLRRITTVFDGATVYVFDCGFTPPDSEEMKLGCDQVEESFQVE